MRRAAFFVSLVASCGSSDETSYVDEDRTVTQAGDTCGEWRVEPPGSPTITRVNATCAAGMTCLYDVFVYPPDEIGNRYGICRPDDALQCDAGDLDSPCPDGWGCVSGFGVRSPGECFMDCQENADCPAPYQVCSGWCRIMQCPLSSQADGGVSDPCPTGSSCQRGICVR
jgi:hypothetical protein